MDSSLPLARYSAQPALDTLRELLTKLMRASHRLFRRADEVLQILAPPTLGQEQASFEANGIGLGRQQVRLAEEPARSGSRFFGKSDLAAGGVPG